MNRSVFHLISLVAIVFHTLCAAQQKTTLYFSSVEYDAGSIYKQDLNQLDIPFQNVLSSEIIIKQITYTGASLYILRSRYNKDTLAPGQYDTLHFYLNTYSGLPDGRYNQEWTISLQNHEPVLLHFSCELQTNSSFIAHDTLKLPTVNYGDTIRFHYLARNLGNQPITLFKAHYYNQLSLLTNYPLTIHPGEAETLYFELATKNLMNHYENSIRLPTNSDSMPYFRMTYAGDLIAPGKPSIWFDTTTLSLYINKGEQADFIFWFTNNGDEPLIISIVKSSCGCLVPNYPRDPIMPGERAFVKGHYDSNRIGPINKTMTVHTNASDDPIILRILGNVAPITTE